MSGSAKERPTRNRKRRLLTGLLPIISVLLVLIIGELTLRFYHVVRYKISFVTGESSGDGGPRSITFDTELGWRATENYRFEGNLASADDVPYPARVSQDGKGFRMFGDPESKKLKAFVIGDSFTQAVEVSDDNTYYAV